jgi:tetratricopeptide (TPR) repeat protein
VDLRGQLQRGFGDSYTIERELGGGGMSRVFEATEIALGRKVVIKVLAPELMQGVSVERFKREIQLSAQLQHPHIVGVLNAGETQDPQSGWRVPYYTMPLVDGQSLRSRILKSGALPTGDVISILRDVAKALAYAHEHGVVHRDIKPDNVLITGSSAVVTDFGIAKAIAAARTDPGHKTLTESGGAIGTPGYMAPEQAAGDPGTDHRADVYAFGVLAYEMLTGRTPFHDRAPHQLVAAQMTETPPDVADIRADTPPLLAELVMRCVERDADSRPQTAAHLVKVLENVTSGSGLAMPEVLLGGRPRLGRALAYWALAFVAVIIVARAAIIALGLPDWVFPGAIVVMTLGLPVILFTYAVHRVTHRALVMPAVTPGGSPARSSPLQRFARRVSPYVSWRRTTMGGVLAVTVFTLLVGTFMLLRAFGIGPAGSLFASGVLQKNERILVGDFRSAGRDTTLGSVVTEAFRTGLGQSQSMMVMSATSLRDALSRMQRNAKTPVEGAVAREIATREGIKAYVDGDILSVGGRYAISVRLTQTSTGETLAALSETADSERDILPAIDKLTRRLRERAGESVTRIREALPLEQVTTPSLEALRKYVQGTQVLNFDGDFDRGTRLLEQAIALDTAFSMAYRKLVAEYTNHHVEPMRSVEYAMKAYRHRDRLTEIERYLTSGSYYTFGPEPDIEKAISAYESVLDIQPTNWLATHNLSYMNSLTHRYQRANEFILRAVRLPEASAASYNALGYLGLAVGDTAQVRLALRVLERRFSLNVFSATARIHMLYELGDIDSAIALARRTADGPGDAAGRSGAMRLLAGIVGARGQVVDMRVALAKAAMLRQQAGDTAVLTSALDSALIDVYILDNVTRARGTLDRALTAHPIASLPHAERPYTPLVHLLALVGRTNLAKQVAALFDRDSATFRRFEDGRIRHGMAGDIALAERRYDDAAREYRMAADAPDRCRICFWPYEAHAYDLAGKRDSAIAIFTRYVETGDPWRSGDTWGASHLVDASWLAASYLRLGELWEKKGDHAKAASYYGRFVDLWKNADPELQPRVAEVRRRLARLRVE